MLGGGIFFNFIVFACTGKLKPSHWNDCTNHANVFKAFKSKAKFWHYCTALMMSKGQYLLYFFIYHGGYYSINNLLVKKKRNELMEKSIAWSSTVVHQKRTADHWWRTAILRMVKKKNLESQNRFKLPFYRKTQI